MHVHVWVKFNLQLLQHKTLIDLIKIDEFVSEINNFDLKKCLPVQRKSNRCDFPEEVYTTALYNKVSLIKCRWVN